MNDIAILLATYNGEKYLSEQIDSLLNQTETNWICYIHDDGSNDKTLIIAKEYEEKYPSKIKILDYPPQSGAKQNFISMLKLIDEPYAMFCDQDDIWLPHKISIELSKMKEIENDGVEREILVYSDSKVVDSDLNIIYESLLHHLEIQPMNDLRFFLFNNCIQGATIMMNKALYSRVSRCDANNIPMHDQWCAAAAAANGTIGFIDVPLLLYRQHENNIIGAGAGTNHLQKAGLFFNKREKQKYLDDTFEPLITMAGEVLKNCKIQGEEYETVYNLYNYKSLKINQRIKLLKDLKVKPSGIILRAFYS